MKVTQQIDALRVSAIPILNYLVVPKLLACILCLPLLTVIADVVGIIGGGILAIIMGMTTAGWYAKITAQFIEFADFFPGLIKASFFGFLIACISSYFGFNTQRGTQSVGKATTTAVVIPIIMARIPPPMMPTTSAITVSKGRQRIQASNLGTTR